MVKIGNIELPDFPLLLAPMEDVSDPPFRAVCKDYGVDMMYTEFVSSEGLIRDAIQSRKKLDIFQYERPVGIQVFGGDAGGMEMAAQIIDVTNPNVIDINFGCPVKKVVRQGAGAAVLKDVDLMVSLTKSVIKSTDKPVTVKTRLGWDEDSKNIEEVAERLQDVGIQALSIHGRTRVQMYKGTADWTLIGKIKNNPRIHIPIFGNGDIKTPQMAVEYKNRYGVDGVMIGRGAIGRPWVFKQIRHYINTGEIIPPPDISERIKVCRKHLTKSLEWKGPIAGVNEMRRHYANYLRDLPGGKEYRMKLVTTKEPELLFEILDEVERKYDGYVFELQGVNNEPVAVHKTA